MLAAFGPALAVLLLVVEAPPTAPLGVLLKAGPAPKELSDAERKAREKELDKLYDERLRAWQALDKDLQKRFGKKRDKWPAEQTRALGNAAESTWAAATERTFVKSDAHYADSVDDLRKVLAKGGPLREVSSPREASFVIEVLARKTSFGIGARNRLLCRVSLGDKIGAKRRQAADWTKMDWPPVPSYADTWERTIVHSGTLKEPWWTIHEADQGTWTNLAGGVLSGLYEFMKKDGAALIGQEAKR